MLLRAALLDVWPDSLDLATGESLGIFWMLRVAVAASGTGS